MKPKYPEIEVSLIGEDSNAFHIMGLVTNALKRAGHRDQVEAFRDEAMSGDFDNLIQTCMKWVNVT